MSLALIGDGGHARDILVTLTPSSEGGEQIRHYAHHRKMPPNDLSAVLIAVNDSQLRARIASELAREDLSWVHPHAFIGPDCSWGPGTHINYGVTMTRTTIGHHCTIAPGVTICGDVTIGDRVFIGAGAVIVNLTTVPDDTFIKAGTVWTQR